MTCEIGWIPAVDDRRFVLRRRMFCKLDLCSILGLIVVAWMTLNLAWADQLIRPVYVYEGLIKSIRDYFNNTCIILLHNNPNPIETQGLTESDHLLVLQRYLSMNHNIRTTFMDFHMFSTRVGQRYYHIKRPLFVLLNDHEDTRDGFAHISTWITMAYPTWLVFFKNETKFVDFFFEIYVPFDCKFMVAQSSPNVIGREIITEVYQVDRGKQLRSMRFGIWDARSGLNGPTRGLFLRRNNLYGQNIRVTSVHDPPISLFHRNERNEITGMSGFFGEVILLLQQALNCTFTYKEAKSWGVCLPNGSCTGAIGMLMNNDVDFAATEFMMTSDRLDAISFTTPIYTTKCRAYIKRPASSDVKWDAYTAPFSRNIWGAIALFIVLTSGSIVLIQRLFAFASPYLQNNGRSRFTEILFFVLGAFCNQGMEQSTLDPVRMVHFVIHLSAVVIVAAYSAALISFLAVKTFIMPFTTMDGLLKDKTYRFGAVGDSADFSFFQNTSDKIMSVLFDELITKETDLPSNYLDGLERVCKEDKYAFMTLDNMAALLQQKVDCKLEPLDVITQTTIAMALQVNSPYRGIINANILLLRDSGILQRLMDTQWSVQLSNAKPSWKSVEIGDIVPLLLFVVAALFISCLVCALERIIFASISNRIKLKVAKNKSRQPK
ncbi:PREDICTED: glutamate receptor ionotropic, delta-1-like isoform X2 [Wasmannia auropunctata]|uniref:glutamate receptor ionotropic, delta-1-like isoform X2 n=1 Tax=Wasmannia auropunctata TaxID=64793 RepID=UPI0005F0BFEE|nr:PREDICTED: glutamate receptor ionotropic, delta-1-like isoform X2 [Wasmannia auropunctata]